MVNMRIQLDNVEKNRLKDEVERKKRRDVMRRKERMLEAAFDGDNDQVLAILQEVRYQ